MNGFFCKSDTGSCPGSGSVQGIINLLKNILTVAKIFGLLQWGGGGVLGWGL